MTRGKVLVVAEPGVPTEVRATQPRAPTAPRTHAHRTRARTKRYRQGLTSQWVIVTRIDPSRLGDSCA
jgi:hypothetical protein